MKTPDTDAGSPSAGPAADPAEAEKKSINQELWQACAGPLVNLPAAGTHVVYFPQGHSEQVATCMKKDVNVQIPDYPNLPSMLLCLLHNLTLHTDPETDEVYAQMTLQPVPSFDKDALLRSDISMKQNKRQTEFFCKVLTASDTRTHGGFSVPRRAAEKIFPPLDFTMQPPAQELVARDLHNYVWTFRHIYRGQPKRHLLTTGWSLFISGKRLFAGDSLLFIRDEKQKLLLGTRRVNKQSANLSSSVLSSDSMHIGILAAAAHAAANSSPFTVFYNPRASPSEFVIPLAKYYNAVCSNQISLGMRFRMMFETEESGTTRYMGTVTGASDLDPVKWKNSQWRNLQVGWDKSSAEDKCNRVSIWEIEPVASPFFICPTTYFRSRQHGMSDDDSSIPDNTYKRTIPWLGDDFGAPKDSQSLPRLSLVQWMNMQQNLTNSLQPNYLQSLSNSSLQNQTRSVFSGQSNNNTMLPMNMQSTSLSSSSSELQQILNQTQQQQSQMNSQNAGPTSQPLNLSENLHLQLLQRLQYQQQQTILAQQTQMVGPTDQASHVIPQQGNVGHTLNPNNPLAMAGSSLHQGGAGGGGDQSGMTDEIPSCSTSLSMNNCPDIIQPVTNTIRTLQTTPVQDDTTRISATGLSISGLETNSFGNNNNMVNDSQQKIAPKNLNQGYFDQNTYHIGSATQLEYLDSSSSATSVCLSQKEPHLRHNPNQTLFDSQPSLFIDINQENHDEVHLILNSGIITNSVKTDNLISPPLVSQPFGVPDMVFNAINNSSFMNTGAWCSPPRLPRRTYTKVYKRGAVGRTIDIMLYAGYEELKQDLACRFGIEGQLEDHQRIGWKLVYVDHENDVLLVGDDPWEEFVNCVQCIKILSPLEVQQLSLDGEF